MKKIFLSLAAVISAVTLMAQALPTACDAQIEFKYCFTKSVSVNKPCYSSQLPYTYKYNATDSVTFSAFGETHTFTIPQVRGCDSIVTMTLVEKPLPLGVACGQNAKPFSISANAKVFVSQGNLQFCPSPVEGDTTHKVAEGPNQKGIFKFAENQYNYVGTPSSNSQNFPGNVYHKESAGGDDVKSQNSYSNSHENYHGWLDLFVWGNSGYVNAPYSRIGNVAEIQQDISETNYDWGTFNAISNGGDSVGLWRLLTKDEWNYLMNDRPNATSLRGTAKITLENNSEVYGWILLPDDFEAVHSSSITFISNIQFLNKNVLTLAQWKLLEQDGAVLFPGSSTDNPGSSISGVTLWDAMKIWTGSHSQDSPSSTSYPYIYQLYQSKIVAEKNGWLYPVRLFQDYE